MVKCTECKQDIDFLNYQQHGWQEGELRISRTQGNEYTNTVFNRNSGSCPDYSCPKCDYSLAQNHEDAIKFLKGGSEGYVVEKWECAGISSPMTLIKAKELVDAWNAKYPHEEYRCVINQNDP